MDTRFKQRYLKWLALTLFLTFDLIVFGAYVRLSDSGLGCPDWPGCYAKLTPWQALEHIRLEEGLRPDGAVTHFKAWIEMIHRYVATGLGILCIGLLYFGIKGRQQLGVSPKLAAFTLFWICLQGAFGAWTVTLKLMPIIVTGHLIGGLTLLALLVWQHTRLSEPWHIQPNAYKQKTWVWVLFACVIAQIMLGGWVSTNYASLACNTFPLCQGQLVPAMDFQHGFSLWRDLGETKSGEWLPFPALVAIHWVHRSFAVIVLSIASWTLVKLKPFAIFKPYRIGLMAVITLQILTGLGNIVLNYPLLAAALHTAGAAMLVFMLTKLLSKLHTATIAP